MTVNKVYGTRYTIRIVCNNGLANLYNEVIADIAGIISGGVAMVLILAYTRVLSWNVLRVPLLIAG